MRIIASRRAAISTTAGTPVKSCKTTRPTMNGTSTCCGLTASQFATCATCSSVTKNPSTLRRQDSSRTRIEKGRVSI